MARGRRAMGSANANEATARNGRVGRRKGGRGRGRGASDGRLADIVARYTSDLVAAVRQEVRRSVADEVRDILTGSRGPSITAGRSRRSAGNGRKRVVQCIAPGCPNPSKGPRFHYLCDKHKDAKKADYEAWRKARKEKQAA
jgi:hypothetical protein